MPRRVHGSASSAPHKPPAFSNLSRPVVPTAIWRSVRDHGQAERARYASIKDRHWTTFCLPELSVPGVHPDPSIVSYLTFLLNY